MTNLEKSKRAIAKAKNADEYMKICSAENEAFYKFRDKVIFDDEYFGKLNKELLIIWLNKKTKWRKYS